MAPPRGRNRHRSSYRSRRNRRDLPQPRVRIDEVVNAAQVSGTRRSEIYRVNSAPEVGAEYAPALFTLFPELAGRLAWVSLRGADQPVPPKQLHRSQHLFGSNYVFMKQEELDLYIIPENSARKLEFIMGDALRRGRTKFVSSGVIGSHHCLSLVKAAHELGHRSEVVLKRCPLTSEALQMAGAIQSLGGTLKLRDTEGGYQWTRRWQDFWAKIFRHEIVPPGGFSSKGALGYVNAMAELRTQVDAGLVPMPDLLVISVESGSTLVGLEIGKRLVGLDSMRILAFQTAESETLAAEPLVALAQSTSELLNRFLEKPLSHPWSEKDFEVVDDYLFGGFGIVPDFLTRWESQFAELESIELGENSSLKGLYGLTDFISKVGVKDKKILFWNTFCPFRLGDLGENFSYAQLPWKLKRWIRSELKEGRLPEVGKI